MRRTKLTPDEVAQTILSMMLPAVSAMVQASRRGGDITGHCRDLSDALAHELPRMAAEHCLESPYCDVTNVEWRDAYEEAKQLIADIEGIDREPTEEEISDTHEARLERFAEDRRYEDDGRGCA